jgi:hypothetical protein
MRRRVQHDEQGVALVLALAFMVLIGVVTTALLSSLISAVGSRSTLDKVRNRQYAADAGVEQAIATVRAVPAPGPGLASCGGPYFSSLNGADIRVECTNVPTLTTTGFVQRNVVFTSCADTQANTACTTATTIVRAQVNYEALDAETPTVTKTYIQSWTVSR